ncbi:MAG: hypothetical protein ACTS3T_18175 [Almyronema sp.]
MKKLSTRTTWLAAAIAVAISVGSVAGYWQRSQQQSASKSANLSTTPARLKPLPNNFAQKSVGRSPQFFATAKTTLLKATPVAERLPTISTGRSDPFISPFIPSRPLVTPSPTQNISTPVPPSPGITTATQPAQVPQPVQPPTPVATQPLPTPPNRTPLASLPLPPELPTLSIANIPLGVPITTATNATAAAAIQISGVMQLADQVSILVQEPQAETGRYVQVGDYLANGQVRISRVEWTAGQDPIVILEQAGREYVKTVGGATLAQAR